jgi:ABC-type Mn2+/Zn2+ transport system permease subunit
MELADFLLAPLRSGIAVRALAELALLGALGGALGFWVLTFGLSYGAESMAHGLLPGAVLAALLAVPLGLGALAGVVVTAVLITVAGRDERVGVEAGTAVAVTGLIAAGAALALVPAAPIRLEDLLFGDPLAVDGGDLAVVAALVLLGGTALAALHRPLGAVAFDPAAARAAGLSAGGVTLALAGLVALTVLVGLEGLGNLLVLAVLVAPAAAIRRHARSPAAAMLAGAGVAVAAAIVGVYASYHLETAAGASVALALCAAAAVGAAVPARGRPRRPAPAPARPAG